MKRLAITGVAVLTVLVVAVLALSGRCFTSASTEVPRQPGSDAAPSPGATISITADGYTPRTLSVSVGSTVRWTNHDSAAHNVGGSGLVSGVLEPGQGYSHRFDMPGVYQYICTLHPEAEGGSVEVLPR